MAFDAPVLRGAADTNQVLVEDSCTDGKNAGVTEANAMWKNSPFKSNCVYAWSSSDPNIDEGAADLKEEEFPDNTGNWQTDTYNECARDYGVDPTVESIKKACFENGDNCIDLGSAAASMIANGYAQSHNCVSSYSSDNGSTDYEQQCRDVAIGFCKGDVYNQIAQMCTNDMPSTNELNDMMDDCEDEVNGLVPLPTEPTTRKPTSRPTKSPTRKPIRNTPDPDRGKCAREPSSDFCFTARQQCCSSSKKDSKWKPFCDFYGFPPKAGEQYSWTFNVVDQGIDCTMCGQTKCPKNANHLELDSESIKVELTAVGISDE